MYEITHISKSSCNYFNYNNDCYSLSFFVEKSAPFMNIPNEMQFINMSAQIRTVIATEVLECDHSETKKLYINNNTSKTTSNNLYIAIKRLKYPCQSFFVTFAANPFINENVTTA